VKYSVISSSVAACTFFICMNSYALWYANLDFEAESPNTTPGCVLDTTFIKDYFDFRLNPVELNWKKYPFRWEGGGQNSLLFQSNGSTVLRVQSTPTPISNEKDRAEYIAHDNILPDQEYYFKFDVYIPFNTTSYPYPDNWFILMQVRQNGGKYQSPSLSINYKMDGSLAVVGRSEQDGYRELIGIPLTTRRNTWFTILVHFRMGENGIVRILDNNQWTPFQYFDLKWNDCVEIPCADTYSLRFGIYRGSTTKPTFLNFDNVMLYDSIPY
jgi:Polysaccharide lyase